MDEFVKIFGPKSNVKTDPRESYFEGNGEIEQL